MLERDWDSHLFIGQKGTPVCGTPSFCAVRLTRSSLPNGCGRLIARRIASVSASVLNHPLIERATIQIPFGEHKGVGSLNSILVDTVKTSHANRQRQQRRD